MGHRLTYVAAIAALATIFATVTDSGVVAAERVFVLSQTGAALSEIEADAEKASAPISLDKGPAAITISPGSHVAYITHSELGQISVVDLEQRSVTGRLLVEGSPFGIAVTKNGRLFVGDWNSAYISVIEPGEQKPSRKVEVGRAPAHLRLTPDETLLFVANRESNDVSAIRTADLSVAATIPVGHAPFAMALSPDGNRLYVANVQSGDVTVIDTATLSVSSTLQSGAMPYGAAVTPDGSRVLVTNQQASTVSILGAGDGSPPIKVGGYPEEVVISADGTRAYVANWFSDDVSVLDLATSKQIRRIKTPGGPRGLAVWSNAP